LIFTGLYSLVYGNTLFSPGGLNEQAGAAPLNGVSSHAEINNCAGCHTAFWESATMADRCLACHLSVAGELDADQGLHAAIRTAGPVNCRLCHSEHNGPQAQLTGSFPQPFPHDSLGFSLVGHSTLPDGSDFECEDCHIGGINYLDQGVCQDCHLELDQAYMEIHLAQFHPECLECHDGVDRYGDSFDHNRLDFPLEGGHAELECASCHAEVRTAQDFSRAAGECYDCHQENDAHAGEFGTSCGSCHSSDSWQGAEFDHQQTNFPLIGLHQLVACQDCHQDSGYQGTPQTCYACHQADDTHQGELGTDCQICHTPSGWDEVIFNHASTTFPLTGAHLPLACPDCHSGGDFSQASGACASCHADPDFHLGLFSSDCAACHATKAWSPARFDQAHTFPLNHGEAPSDCRLCHPASLNEYTCYGCHEHSPAEIEEEHLEEDIRDFQDCMRCHPDGEEPEDD
jgi:hypothetical protein